MQNSFGRQQESQQQRQLYVEFYSRPLKDEARTREEGRPIYEDVDYVKIVTPGSRDFVARPARTDDVERWRPQWDAYKAGQDQQATVGTPLSEWPQVTRAQVEELKYFGVHTVEQLADLRDGNAQNFMGVLDLKNRAKAYLERAAEEAPAARLEAELADRDQRIAALEARIGDMASEAEKAEQSETEEEKPGLKERLLGKSKE